MISSRDRIEQVNAQGRAALLAYLPLGFPTVEKSIQAAKTLVDNGVDVIELGFPYSDPGMDGPVIQRAGAIALEQGTHLEDLFAAVREIGSTGAPVVTMTYWNPVNWFGVDRFAQEFSAAGGSGLITPDLPPEEAQEWIEASKQQDLERIFLVAPSSTDDRLRKIAAASNGWVYAASTMGVTGKRDKLDDSARELVERARAEGAEVVCVEVGVYTADQARTVGRYANGVIVGSAFVDLLFEADWDVALDRVAKLASALRGALPGRGE